MEEGKREASVWQRREMQWRERRDETETSKLLLEWFGVFPLRTKGLAVNLKGYIVRKTAEKRAKD